MAIFSPYILGVTATQNGVSYDGRGSVISLDGKKERITLKHEEIKGLMSAMTMEFPVKSPALLDGVHPSDRVHFTLSPQGGDFIVEKIVKEEREGLR